MASKPLRVFHAASEAEPFIKTGGLADIMMSLPKALAARGHDVRAAIPKYRELEYDEGETVVVLPELNIWYGGTQYTGQVLETAFPDTDIAVYLMDFPGLFDRDGIYEPPGGQFTDNDRRFGVFSLALLWLMKGIDWRPDIVHAHDWQTGLLPVLLKAHPEVLAEGFHQDIRTVFTIHNLAYQGNFSPEILSNMFLPWSLFSPEGLEFYGKASMLKAGLVYSDVITTVSPSYAEEIQTKEFGAGLDGLLRKRSSDLKGILNGIDTALWNPEADPYIAAPVNPWGDAGKALCKAALQKRFGLPKRHCPLVGMTSRLAAQKGIDLVLRVLPELAQRDVQFVLLGSGDARFERAFEDLASQHPKRIAVHTGFDNERAHQIYAGADMLLVPSAFEPCGLTQMYAMRYGTVPVVRAVGGLRDTVRHADVPSIEAGEATGFLFSDYTAEALLAAVEQAMELYRDDKPHWGKLRRNGMARDFSWGHSAQLYEALYDRLLSGLGV
ncbi:MAG: glycogen synthase GlgA [Candidatus Sumerlaeia bacterium]|nr:glycogen synthase GlgA [Candidatus Sumerlaeia bacterium]